MRISEYCMFTDACPPEMALPLSPQQAASGIVNVHDGGELQIDGPRRRRPGFLCATLRSCMIRCPGRLTVSREIAADAPPRIVDDRVSSSLIPGQYGGRLHCRRASAGA